MLTKDNGNITFLFLLSVVFSSLSHAKLIGECSSADGEIRSIATPTEDFVIVMGVKYPMSSVKVQVEPVKVISETDRTIISVQHIIVDAKNQKFPLALKYMEETGRVEKFDSVSQMILCKFVKVAK